MMKYSIAFMLACMVVASYANVFDREIDAHWEEHKIKHPKAHHLSQHDKRKANFARIHKKIEAHNAQKLSYTMGHNILSDLHPEEFQALLGARPPNGTRSEWTESFGESRAPASIDYRTSPCMQTPRNQGGCGSCWSFSATAALEFANCRKNGQAIALSEQQLVDCDSVDHGCNGGWPTNAWNYVKSAGGQSKANYYTYKGQQGSCAFNPATVGARVSSYVNVSPNANAIMTALDTYGVLSVAIMADNNFGQYRSGVYRSSGCGGQVNHAVNLVGYTTYNGEPVWIGRNSWGTTWGMNGFFMMPRNVNMCQIESNPMAVIAA
jgi:C1A family cysteine protease